MVRINKVYTKTGDQGETSLVKGVRIAKDHPRVEAYGTTDELNSVIGLVRCFNLEKAQSEDRDRLESILKNIQNRLFDIGSLLATPPGVERPTNKQISEANVTWLENIIDSMNEQLKPLSSFTLPGGSSVLAFLHQARTVCRRAERRIVTLNRDEPVDPQLIAYINRLSDALFVFSRWSAVKLGETEFLWQPGKEDEGG